MSNWTHVSAIVRLNNIKLAMINPHKLMQANVIRDLHGAHKLDPAQESIDEVLECFNKDVPTGSEGPLKVALNIWPTTEDYRESCSTTHVYKGGMYWGDVVISGDLRDYHTPDEIADWLKECCTNLPKGVGVRDATLYAYAEQGGAVVITHDGESWRDNL